MKKMNILNVLNILKILFAAALAAFCVCGCEKSEDVSEPKGAEIVSDDGSVSIVLPDEGYTVGQLDNGIMSFFSDKGDIFTSHGEEDANGRMYDAMPCTREELEEFYEKSYAGEAEYDMEIKDFSYSEKNGVKYMSDIVYITEYTEDENGEKVTEKYAIIENTSSDGKIYYYAEAETEQNEETVNKLAASLATYGSTDDSK